MAISIENGKVVVDTSRISRRTGYEPAQALPV